MPAIVDEEMYTPQEIAEYMKVDIRTVYRWVREGDMGVVRFGREYRVSERDLREFIDSRRTRREPARQDVARNDATRNEAPGNDVKRVEPDRSVPEQRDPKVEGT